VNRQGGDIFGRVPAWAADGRIIYWECPLDKCGLYSIHPDGTNLARLTTHEHDTTPAISPSGSQAAFMSNTDGNWEVYLTDARQPASEDGQGPTRLTNHPAQDGVPAWSPDGQWLAFISDRDGAWAIWVMRPNGSAQQKLLDLGGSFSGQVDSIPSTEQHGWTWETMAWGP
jgi:Tol biopolymer transport system component